MSKARDLADGTFDTDTLVVDAANNRVGIGTASPTTKGHFYSSTSMDQLSVDGVGAIETGINFKSGGTTYGQIYFNNVSPYDMSVLQQYSTGSLVFGTNDTEALRIDSNRNIKISTDDKQIYWGAGTTAIDGSSSNNRIRFYTDNTEAMQIGSSEIVVNEDSNDLDFRVETDAVSDAFVVNAGANNVMANRFKWLNIVSAYKISSGTANRNVRINNLGGEYYLKVYVVGLCDYNGNRPFSRIIEVTGYGTGEYATVISNNQYGPGYNVSATVTTVNDGILNIYLVPATSTWRYAVMTEMVYGGNDAYVTVDGTDG
jgi:hypothetical protein